MPVNIKKNKTYRSVKLSDQAWYCLKMISTEERQNVYLLAEKIIVEYYDQYFKKNKTQDF